METGFILEQRVLGPHVHLEISKARYDELAHARSILSDALTFEQRYELLLGNFIAMELAFTEISLRSKLEPQFGYSDSAAILSEANRHVINFLTALKSYIDQAPQDFKCLDLDPGFGKVVKQQLESAFERSSDYRFIYTLRNHVQHSANPVHGFEGDADPKGDPNAWVESVKLNANRTSLEEDKEFKKKVLEEQPQKIDVRRRVRQAMNEIGLVHLALRAVANDHVKRARKAVEAAIKEYLDAGADSSVGLVATRVGDINSDVPVFLAWDDVRVQLAQKNARPPRLWPRQTHREASPEQIVQSRERAGQTCSEAASTVFLTEERWRDYEQGLPMPEGLFQLYQLRTGQHPIQCLQPSHPVGGKPAPAAPSGQVPDGA
jgi:hypothetical protein